MAIDLFCFYFIRYGNTTVQIICTFSRSICANDLGKMCLIQCMGKPVLNHWCELSGKMCIQFAQLYLRNE